MARQAKADSEGLQLRLQELEQELETAREDKRDIYEGGSELVGVQGTLGWVQQAGSSAMGCPIFPLAPFHAGPCKTSSSAIIMPP